MKKQLSHFASVNHHHPCSDFMDMLRRLISCRIIIIIMPAEGNGDLQTLICVLVARPRRCLTLLNPVPWQIWMAAYLGYTLRMRMLFCGWPIMVKDTHTRRRLLLSLTTHWADHPFTILFLSDWQPSLWGTKFSSHSATSERCLPRYHMN